ncbi:hypothetical protein ABIC73_004319 [Prescottella equi]
MSDQGFVFVDLETTAVENASTEGLLEIGPMRAVRRLRQDAG